MGREIYCEIRKKGYDPESPNPLWCSVNMNEDFVCGRDDATNFIAMLASDDEKDDWAIPIGRDPKQRLYILKELRAYAKKDEREVDKAKREKRDLLAARRCATKFEDFASFSAAIEETEQWLEENESWSRAQALIDMIDVSVEEFSSHPLKYRDCDLYLVVSE